MYRYVFHSKVTKNYLKGNVLGPAERLIEITPCGTAGRERIPVE